MARRKDTKSHKAFDGNNLIDIAVYPISYVKTLMQVNNK